MAEQKPLVEELRDYANDMHNSLTGYQTGLYLRAATRIQQLQQELQEAYELVRKHHVERD